MPATRQSFLLFFSVDNSKIFLLTGLSAQCIESESCSESKESTACNSTSEISARIPIEFLKRRESEKVSFAELKVELAFQRHELYLYIMHHFEFLLTEPLEEEIGSVKDLVFEIFEWLENNSNASLLGEIKEKLATVGAYQRTLENVVERPEADLTLSSLQALHEGASESAKNLQDYLLQCDREISRLREMYAEEFLDFDTENETITKTIYGAEQSDAFKLDAHLSTIKEGLKDFAEIVSYSEAEFQKIPREDVFSSFDKFTTLLNNMVDDFITSARNHAKRVSYLPDQFEKLVLEKNKLEKRKRLEEILLKRRGEKDAEKDAEDDKPESTVVEDTPNESLDTEPVEKQSSTSSSEQVSSEEVTHDEL